MHSLNWILCMLQYTKREGGRLVMRMQHIPACLLMAFTNLYERRQYLENISVTHQWHIFLSSPSLFFLDHTTGTAHNIVIPKDQLLWAHSVEQLAGWPMHIHSEFYTHTHTHACKQAWAHTCTHARAYTHTHMCTYTRTHTSAYAHIHTSVCTHTCMRVRTYTLRSQPRGPGFES